METLAPLGVIERRIFLIRGQRVMLSTHLADLYNGSCNGSWGRFSYSLFITNRYKLFSWSASLRSPNLHDPLLNLLLKYLCPNNPPLPFSPLSPALPCLYSNKHILDKLSALSHSPFPWHHKSLGSPSGML